MKRTAAIVTCLVAIVAVAGCGGGTGEASTTTSTQAHKTTHHPDHEVSCPGPRYVHGDKFMNTGYRQPGSIRGAVGPPYVAPEEMWDDSNMWWASDCRTFTVVTAGSDGDHHDDGLFVVYRTKWGHADVPHVNLKEVNVPGAGKVEITKAPLGRSVETWAQNRGNIEFTGEHGITGMLHLTDDTVTVNR